MTITAQTLRAAVTKVREPKCEDCVHCRLATHYGDDPAMQVHFARCEHPGAFADYRQSAIPFGGHPFASDTRDNASLCGPSGKWFQAKAGAVE